MKWSSIELLARAERERKEKEMVEKEKNADKVGVKASREPEVGVAGGSARKETQNNDMLHTSNNLKGSGGIMDSEKVVMNIPTPEVKIVKEALKSSSMELKALLNDPLPNALHLSEALMPERKALNKEILVENQWDDSIDGSPEGASGMNRFQLAKPRTKVVSPLKEYKIPKFAGRRKSRERLGFYLYRFGRGNWKAILDFKRDIFYDRTEVDLKDKWRNMTK
ncbi:hypothetical protein GH714_035512 [Hevea brasiliensis]|uniref:Uncharacterized protein n=1 Tax=Hevea brasiliensis TaxID=3981 RepID=A0A6A6N9F6_HEVBR|nr:hypothetical protein GH714_035512 [Hevea brasiliensis]